MTPGESGRGGDVPRISGRGLASASDLPDDERLSSPEELATALEGVRGVLLDVDHTLIDTAHAFSLALAGALHPLLPDAPSPEAAAQIAADWGADRSGWYRAYTRGELSYDEQRLNRVNEVLGAHGAQVLDADGYEAFSRAFDDDFARGWRAFPDVRDALDALGKSGLALGALTNAGRSLQERKLAAAGLEDLPVLVTVENLGFGKPDPRVFWEGARLLGLEPHEVAYIGDEDDIDARAAARAGLVGIHLERPGHGRPRHGGTDAEHGDDQGIHVRVGDLTAVSEALALLSEHGPR